MKINAHGMQSNRGTDPVAFFSKLCPAPAESGFAGHSTDSRLCLPALKSIVKV